MNSQGIIDVLTDIDAHGFSAITDCQIAQTIGNHKSAGGFRYAPAYCTSTDAALCLVPEDQGLRIERVGNANRVTIGDVMVAHRGPIAEAIVLAALRFRVMHAV